MKTIYYNGAVYTGALPLVSAFAEEDGCFVFAGNDGDALALAAPGDETIDLNGHFVCSGFQDSHMHLLGFGNALNSALLSEHTKSLAELIACMKEFRDTHSLGEGEWLIGRGWNQDYFTDVRRMPNRYDLDQVSEDVPVCAIRACGHCLVVNSRAIELLGLSPESGQPEGGRIGIEDGQLDGRFFDNAMKLVYASFPTPGKESVKNMILAACRVLNSYGITGCQTDDYSMFRTLPWSVIHDAYRELEEEGRLTVRIYEQSHFFDPDSLLDFIRAGNHTGTGTELFKIGPVKLMGDGALGARTAFLSRPYADDPSTCGFPVFQKDELNEMVGLAHANGMQVAVHSIGDACLDMVLDAYEKAMSEHPRTDCRHGVVHCQITRPDQLERIRRLGLHVYAQSIFLDYDIHMVEDRVGAELASTSYSWKTLMENGVTVSNGSDCPVELPDVMAGIQCAVTRKSLDGLTGPYLPEQAFTVREALDSFTSSSSFACFGEKVKGKIVPGMLADFVILGENPLEKSPDALRSIPILSTYLGGKRVYGRE